MPTFLSSLKNQQLFMFLAAGIIPLILLLLFLGQFVETRGREYAFNQMESTARLVATKVEERIGRRMHEINAVTSSSKIFQREGIDSPQDVTSELQSIYDLFNRGDDLFALFSRDGYPEGSSEIDHVQYGNTKAFQSAAAGIAAASPAHVLISTEELVLAVYHPLRNKDGKVQHVVRHYIPIDDLKPEPNLEGDIIWLNEALEILSGAEHLPVLTRFDEAFKEIDVGKPHGFGRPIEGQRTLYAHIELPASDIFPASHMVYLVPEGTALAWLSHFPLVVLTSGLFSILLLTLVAFYASSRLTAPLLASVNVAERIAQGDLDVELKVEGPDELRKLALSLNAMTTQVRNRRSILEHEIFERTHRLRELTAFTRAIMDGLDDALLVLDAEETSLRFVNRAAMNMFHLDASEGSVSLNQWQEALAEWFEKAPAWTAFWNRLSKSDLTRSKPFTVHHPEMNTVEVSSAPVPGPEGEPIGRLWLFRDVSEREQLEAELRQSQKIEAVGRLAGGLAHDFNNILTAIQGGLELVKIDYEENLDPNESIELSLSGCDRAAGVVQQLLSFSRQRPLELQTIHLRDIIRDTVALVRPSIDRLIRIETEISNEVLPIEADPIQIEQVLMNLLINASHAMPEGGSIRVRCFQKTIGADDEPGRHDFSCIEIQDNGHGMTEDVMEKIFDPFFTTKPQGKGSGLGLATSLGIVQRHHGWIDCKSYPGKGTCFNIFLPSSSESVDESVGEAPIPIQAGFSARILLVDDERSIRNIARHILSRADHQTEEAGNGVEALERLKDKEKPEFDLVILDLTMPMMSGAETLARIRLECPDLPVLIWSGHSEDAPSLFNGSDRPPEGFLSKPFRAAELNHAVAEALNKHRPNKSVHNRNSA